jgi:Kdo2-lipid IVA lauroyltransferase/acyltransferase
LSRPASPTPVHRLEYGAARLVQAGICLLPAGAARELGAGLGSLAYALGIRRDVSLGHLRRIFGGEKTEGELESIARESYRNFGRMTFEFARFTRLTDDMIARTVSITGTEHLDQALECGTGALLIAGHFGNWEMAATLASRGYPVTFLVGEQHNRLVDGLMNRLRQRLGVETVPLTGSLLGVFRALRANRIVAMLSDQDAGRSGVFVDFLGQKASTPYGPGRLAWKTGAPLLPGMALRHGRSNHELVIREAVEPPPEGASEEEAVRHYTQGYTSVFEDFIRRYPEQYFWMHRRWKTRPATC